LDHHYRGDRVRCARSNTRSEYSVLIDHRSSLTLSLLLFQAISPLLDREAPGLVHLILSTSLKHTPLAALSRPVAGTISNTLIVTLPGSTKAVTEILEALLSSGVVDHAVDLIRGGTGHHVHRAMVSSTSGTEDDLQERHHMHHHHHHHQHDVPQPMLLSNNPSLPGRFVFTPIYPHK
jgi:gephyrin